MVNKFILSALALSLTGSIANAQLSQGGLPISLQITNTSNNYVPKHSYANPDWAAYLKQSAAEEITKGITAPYLAGLFTSTDVKFPESGSFTTLDNGQKVWKAQIEIIGAPAIGLYFDKYNLPKGVKVFVSNENGKQVLGAYTNENNDASNEFAIEPVQGKLVNIELNIDANTNINDIQFHINRAAVYQRAIEHLVSFVDDNIDLNLIDAYDNALIGSGSVCMIDANCPEGDNYSIQKAATAQFVMPQGNQGISLCSGTMVNNTGNGNGVCKPYFLTASHCEGSGSTSNATFSQLIVRFNFQKATCGGTTTPQSNTRTGANFVSRAAYNSNQSANSIKGDFLLLELKNTIPESWNVTFAGWNRASSIPLTTNAPKHFIGFHHPSGDAKKVSTTQQIFSGNLGAQGTHWALVNDEGYLAGGSSGSGLFNPEGLVIGIASVAGNTQTPSSSCLVNGRGATATAYDYASYSKVSYDWDYAVDNTGATSKLKPWLDPINAGVNTIPPVTSTCAAISGAGTSINNMDTELEGAVSIYPNPTTNGLVNIKMNLKEKNNVTVEVYDVLGAKKQSINLNNVITKDFQLNLSELANGMYMIKFATDNAQTTKKVMINK